MLIESIDGKIKEAKNDLHESYNPVYNDNLLIEIRIGMVLSQIKQLVNSERKVANALL
jgi:hypothetical protein